MKNLLLWVLLGMGLITTTPISSFGQDDDHKNKIVLDLAKPAGEYSINVDPDEKCEIMIINRINNGKFQYNISTVVRNREIPPLDNKDVAIPDLSKLDGKPSPCDIAAVLITKYEGINKESDLPKLQAEFDQIAGKLDAGCGYKTKFNKYLAKSGSNYKIEKKLKKGQIMTITIVRTGTQANGKKWTWVLNAPKRGEWQTTYGFTHIGNGLTERDDYFLTADNMGGYVITEDSSGADFSVTPTIMWTWMPNSSDYKAFSWSLSGGLGVDFEDPSILLGGTVSYYKNLSLTFGLASHLQQRLRGRYSAGQTISENLESEQLHKKVFAVNFFLSLSFHFKSNPFSNNTEDKESNDEP